MKKDEFLRAVGDIDERFVEEAADVAAPETAEGLEQRTVVAPKKRSLNMKKIGRWAAGIAAVFVVCLGISALSNGDFFRMGGYDSADSMDAPDMGNNGIMAGDFADRKGMMAPEMEESGAYPEADVDYPTESSWNGAPASKDSQAAQHAGVKLIYRADVNMQTTEFDETYDQLKALVEEMGGYFESSNSYNGDYFCDDYLKSGYYSVRLPQEKYKEFLDRLEGDFHVVSLNESVEDVGEEYFDMESHLENLRIKQERLQKLMADAKSTSDIIEIENALSQTEYEIEYYTSNLNRYDSLIGYSTVCVNLDEVGRLEKGVNVDRGFGHSLLESLKSGAANFVDFLEHVAYWFSYNIIGIAVLVVLILVCRKRHWVKRIAAHLPRRK